jgi:hypothetical protein
LFVGLAVALSVTPAFADSQVRIVRLSTIDGSVQADRNLGQGFEKAVQNMPVVQGMQLATKDGRAEVEFEDGSTLRITPKTTVEFNELSLRDSGARVSTLTLKSGMAYVTYSGKRKDDEFTVLFENEKVRLTEAAHFRIDLASDNAEVAVFSGELKVEGPSGEVEVGKNKTATFDLTDKDKFIVAKNIEQAPFDAWDKQQSKYQQEYASRGSYNNYPYGYGVSDLNYYGNYYSVPGYGMMWQPFFTGVGWSPFADGSWMYYPGFGYTWVSAYPWGWMPYRYGNWAFVPGYGWMWAPGAFGGWTTVPPVTNPPNRFPVPKAPVQGTTTVVVGRPGITTGMPPRNLLVQNGSAGLGIPRGTVSNMHRFSQEVQANGSATVRTSPPSRGGVWSGGGSSGGSRMSSGGQTSSGRMSSGSGMSTGGHMGGSSGGHSSAPSSRH